MLKQIPLNDTSVATLQETLLKRSPAQYTQYEEAVSEIVGRVRREKDDALLEYTARFDGVQLIPEQLRVTDAEISAAYEAVSPKLLEVIRKAKANIIRFHEMQRQNSWFDASRPGIVLGQRVTPLAVAGVYVPGGRAVYPSSVLMNVLPAKVAGVERVVMCTPPEKDGSVFASTLVAAKEAGVDEIYRVGGAQAVAAMAHGTQTIPKVDKIVGPGNIYVALAKRAVFGFVDIDSIAGPSEILVLCDDTAVPKYVAADLLSQAEHDPLASAILVTTSARVAEEVRQEIERMLPALSRREIIEQSLSNFGFCLLAESMEQAVDAVNAIASEHLEIITADPFETMTHVKNAGAMFLGSFSSEPLGDYFAGPNHVLPTNGTARFFSPLSVDDFIKKSSVISYSKEALEEVWKDVAAFAECEQLTAHANSMYVRFRDDR